jgi:hypothetical protein
MQDFNFYINLKQSTFGLYVRMDAGLPDLADTSDWQSGNMSGRAN